MNGHVTTHSQVKLTQDLMKLFIEYEISPDQLSVDEVSSIVPRGWMGMR